MSSELSGARGHDGPAEGDGASADRSRGLDAAQIRAREDAYNERHAELIKGQAEANRIAGLFSPIGHVPLTQEARDIVAREAAAKEFASKESASKEAGARDAAGQDQHARAARDAPGSGEERTDQEASLEERMSKLIDDRVRAAAEDMKTDYEAKMADYEAKMEAMRAELDQADAKHQAELDDVHADVDSMKVVSQIAAEKLQAEREEHRKQLDSLQTEHQKETDSLREQIDSLTEQVNALKSGKPAEVRTGESGASSAERDPDKSETSDPQTEAVLAQDGGDRPGWRSNAKLGAYAASVSTVPTIAAIFSQSEATTIGAAAAAFIGWSLAVIVAWRDRGKEKHETARRH